MVTPIKFPKTVSKPFTYRFESMGDVLDYMSLPNQEGNTVNNNSGSDIEKHHSKFSGTANMQEAIHLARHGWKAGRERMVSGVRDTFAGLKVNSLTTGVTLDVAGAVPLAPLAAAGDPCCMLDFVPTERTQRPIIRLIVPFVYSGGVKRHIIENRGIALLSLVDAIEHAGQRCEIDISWTFAQRQDSTIFINVKRAEDDMDLDRLAFAFGHPSMLRRIGFAIMDKSINGDAFAQHGYGTPGRVKENPDGWNLLPGIAYTNTGVYSTIDSSLAYLAPLMIANSAAIGDYSS